LARDTGKEFGDPVEMSGCLNIPREFRAHFSSSLLAVVLLLFTNICCFAFCFLVRCYAEQFVTCVLTHVILNSSAEVESVSVMDTDVILRDCHMSTDGNDCIYLLVIYILEKRHFHSITVNFDLYQWWASKKTILV